VVCTAELTGNLLIQELQDPGVKQIISTLTSNCTGEQFYLVSLQGWEKQTYQDLVLTCLAQSLALVGVVESGKTVLTPHPKMSLGAVTKAILVGRHRPTKLVHSA
jgi:hypothetical protein